MTGAEWEALCDGCGRCCLHTLEDEDTGELFRTNVACRLLDVHTGRCLHYEERFRWVSDCIRLTPTVLLNTDWLPDTCAYRLLARGQPLPHWHPLRTQDPHSTRAAGVSVCGWVVPEQQVKRLEDHILDAGLMFKR